MSNTLQAWGAFIANTKIESVPQRTRRRLRAQVASVLAATFAAEQAPGARKASAWARRSAGPHPLLPTGESVGRMEALVASAARSCALDYDDYCLVGHTGHSSVVVPLVLGSVLDLNWASFEAAQLVSNELGARLGLATFFGPQNGQHMPFVHHVASAAAAARVLRLDANKASHALAIALSQPEAPLWPAFLGAHESKILTAASAVANGAMAAELAFEGLTGPLDVLDHPQGFFHKFAFVPAKGLLTHFGEVWLSDTIHVKEHPACAYFQTAIDAAIETAAQARALLRRALQPSDITAVHIDTTLLGAAVDAHSRGWSTLGQEITANQVNFSLALTTALTLLHGEITPTQLSQPWLSANEASLRQMALRTKVRHAWDLTSRMVLDVIAATGPQIFQGAKLADWAFLPIQLKRTFPELAVERGPLAHLATEIARVLSVRGQLKEPSYERLAQLGFSFGTRLRLILSDGTRLGAERLEPHGAPDRPIEDTEVLARNKLVRNASDKLGIKRAEKLADMVFNPQQGQRVKHLVELLTKKNG